MQQTCRSFGYVHARLFLIGGAYNKCSTRLAGAVTAVGTREDVKLNNEPILNSSSLTQAEISVLEPLEPAKPVSLLDTRPKDDQLSRPLPFEEIPSPLVLKLWQKYWKYVPLLGTQLFRSLLINGLTEGRLHWNRNVTPLRYLFNEYGPVVRINGPIAGKIVLIHRPEHVAKVYEEEGQEPVRSAIDILQHYRQHHRKYRFVGPYSAQGSQVVDWLAQKKSLRVAIQDELAKQFGPLEMVCEELLVRIHQIKNRQDEVPGDFAQEITRWSLESFWVLMLNKKLGFLDPAGYQEGSEAHRFMDALRTANRYMSLCETGFQVWRFFDTPFCMRLFGACDVIDGIIAKYMRLVQSKNQRSETPLVRDTDKHSSSSSSSILENLLLKQRMNPDDVSSILMDMIILGVQATASTQAFLLYFLAKNPRAQRTLYDEINSRTKDHVLSVKIIASMPYLSACLKECLRLRPPFPYVTRQLSKNITLHGYKIPKDTYVIMANQIACQREENFEDPEKFRPERWLKSSDEVHDEHSFLPFGKGLRSCAGENMAKLQIMLLTAKLLREYKVEYDYGDIKSSFYMLNVPNKPLRFRFVERD